MNMITKEFPIDKIASSEQSKLTKKLTSAWEKKNSKIAKAGGLSLMALTLAACGAEDDTPYSIDDVTAATVAAETAAAATAVTVAAAAVVAQADAVAAAEFVAGIAAEAAAAAAVVAQADAVAAAEFVAGIAATAAAAAAVVSSAEAAAAAVVVAEAAAAVAQAAAVSAATAAAEAVAASAAAALKVTTDATLATLQGTYDALVAPKSLALTTANDTLTGGSGSDTFTGTAATYADTDRIIDSSSDDADVANIVENTAATPNISGVETVNFTIQNTGAQTLNAASLTGVTNLNYTKGDVTVGGSVISGNKVVTVTNMDAADVAIFTAGAGTTGVTLTQATNDGAIVNLNTATGTVVVNGVGTINAALATGTITVDGIGDTTAATALVLNAATATTVAIGSNTAVTGAMTVNAAAATTVGITAAGGGSVNAQAVGANFTITAIDGSGFDITAGASATGNTVGMNVDGSAGTSDSVTVTAAGNVDLTTNASAQIETVNLSGNGAAATYTLVGAPTTINVTGSQNVTIKGNESLFDGKTLTDSSTGTVTVDLTTFNNSDVSGIAADVISVSGNTASKTLTVASGATVDQAADISTAFTVNGKVAKSAVTFRTGDDTAASGATIDITNGTLTAGANISTFNVEANVGKLTTTAATATLNVSGNKAVDLGNLTTLTLDASGATGAITANTQASVTTIKTGSANDTITVDGLAVAVESGAGVDTVNLNNGAGEGTSLDAGAGDDLITIDDVSAMVVVGGEGNDTVTVTHARNDTDTIIALGAGSADKIAFATTGAADLSDNVNFAMSGIEQVTLAASGVVTMSAAQFAGDNTFTLTGTSAATDNLIVNGIAGAQTINAAGLTTVTNATLILNGAAGKDNITGSAGSDTIKFSMGGDVIEGGLGTDTLDAAANISGASAGTGSANVQGIIANFGTTAVSETSIFANTAGYLGAGQTSVASGTANLTYAGDLAANIFESTSVQGMEVVLGTVLADYIVLGGNVTSVTAGAGADYIVSSANADTLTLNNVANIKATADQVVGYTAVDSILIQAAGQFGDLHQGDGAAFTGAKANSVSVFNVAGAADAAIAAASTIISINANSAALANGYGSFTALRTGYSALEIKENGGGTFANGDEVVIVYHNTATTSYDVGILTIAGGQGIKGTDETFELLVSVDSTGVTQAEVAASIDFIA